MHPVAGNFSVIPLCERVGRARPPRCSRQCGAKPYLAGVGRQTMGILRAKKTGANRAPEQQRQEENGDAADEPHTYRI